jgi:methylmalonyl-CoA mutase N-terminal domain/subunit
VPRWNTISISGYHIREAGSTAVQELAFTLANGKAYLQAALKKNLDINVFAKRLSFFFNCHNNFFEEIAKFRAARRMWAHVTKQMGATDINAQKLRFHAQTGGSTLTAQQPMNNIVRVSNQAMAAVLGGTQSLHTNGYDEAMSLPTEAAAKIALRTQQIIAFESGVTDTVDPLAGSYFVEALTNQMEAAAQAYIDKIDAMGGAVKAIEQNYIQEEIARSAYQYQQEIENGNRVVVGVNKFEQHEAAATNVFRVDDAIRIHQIEKLEKLKNQRDKKNVNTALKSLKEAALGDVNLMPFILTAVECYATLGEIADTLRGVFGEY